MSHANAALTPLHRLRVGRLVVEDGWSVAAAADHFRVSWPTAKRWSDRYRAVVAATGRAPVAAEMTDRSSRPLRSPARTPDPVVRRLVSLRWRRRMGPVQLAAVTGVPASTVHAVLVRVGANRLTHIDPRSREPIRRYEHELPGSLVHVDVKKLGQIPDGGGWPFVGRAQGTRNRSSTRGKRGTKGRPQTGHCFVHSVLDDHSRVVYSEIREDEKAHTAVEVLRRATAWFAARGVRIERALTDNGGCYRARIWKQACAELGIQHKRTRPYRPQTNGKVERFHRTLADGWARARYYPSESARRNALPAWIHYYNHHRPHTAIGSQPPITRLTNVPAQYS